MIITNTWKIHDKVSPIILPINYNYTFEIFWEFEKKRSHAANQVKTIRMISRNR